MKIKIPKVKQVWVPWSQWECVEAGMFDSAGCVSTDFEQFKVIYAEFLADSDRFSDAARRMCNAWPMSCLNFLTNAQINRIAWIGQASACYEIGLCYMFKGGFWLLSSTQQEEANRVAAIVLRDWIIEHNQHRKADQTIRRNLEEQMLFGWDTR